MIDILYEDNHIIAVNKKPSEIVQGDKTGDTPLSDIIKLYLKEKYNKPGDVYLATLHRIDRPVSGVVIFGKTSKAAERLSKLFQSREMKKTYLAVVKNKPEEPEGKLVHYLLKNEKQNKSYVHQSDKKGALKSELDYKLIAASDNYYLLEINPVTGRHHQIRVQLAAIGSPIKGDVKYGFDRTNKDVSIHLHAWKLAFIHPVKKEEIKIEAPPPPDPIWDYFKNTVL